MVDDEKAVGRLCRMFLHTQGYTVLLTETPDEALQLAARFAGEIHLLVLGLCMPSIDGRQLAEWLVDGLPSDRRSLLVRSHGESV